MFIPKVIGNQKSCLNLGYLKGKVLNNWGYYSYIINTTVQSIQLIFSFLSVLEKNKLLEIQKEVYWGIKLRV